MLFVVDDQVLECSSANRMPFIAHGVENDINPRKHTSNVELKQHTTLGSYADWSRAE